MGYEVDFIGVGQESKSGDAIAIRFGNLQKKVPGWGWPVQTSGSTLYQRGRSSIQILSPLPIFRFRKIRS
ncbi:MAG: hypothetical protein ACPGF7_05165 [Pontibacterium sp.]